MEKPRQMKDLELISPSNKITPPPPPDILNGIDCSLRVE